MRNISHYEQKLSQSSSLSDLERNAKSAHRQLETDKKNLKDKRDRLMDSVKKLDAEIAEIPTIQKRIVKITHSRAKTLMGNLMGDKPKPVKKRQPKKVTSKAAIKKDS